MIMSNDRNVRVVLMHPPLRNMVVAATPDYVDENRGYTPPLGLLYIQSAIERSRHESVFLDAHLEGWDHVEAARQALAHDPDIVGIQAMTFTIRDAHLLALAIKRLRPDVKVLIGGPHPTLYPYETASLEAIDFAFAGEGELGIVKFLDAFHDAEACANVPGIACKINGRINVTPSTGYIEDLNHVPFPARRSSSYKRYSSVLAQRHPITVAITSRGCPFSCIFCNRMGRRYRCHSAEYVLAEFEDIVSLGIGEVFIHDDVFTLHRERVEAICRGLIARRPDLIWQARTRVDLVDEEMLALMRESGCQRLSFGVESGSEKVLRSMHKDIDLNRVEKVFSWCRREGIVTLADFMIGNLDETAEDVEKTLALMKRINPDYVQFSICSPYPGTALYELGQTRGLIQSDVWLDFAKNPLSKFRSLVWTEHFSEEELVRMTAKAYRSFYLRPMFILKQMRKINSFQQLKTMARGAIGMMAK